MLFHEINEELAPFGVKIETNTEYVPAYLKEVLNRYSSIYEIDETKFVHGIGKKKSKLQKAVEELEGYIERTKKYIMEKPIKNP